MQWWGWLIISLIIGIIEVSSLTFVLLWIAVAGVLTSLLTLLSYHFGWPVQVAFFVIISAILIAATRPLVRKWRRQKDGFESLPHRQVGKTGHVVTDTTPTKHAIIRVDGEMWSAVANKPLHVGQKVQIDSADSAVLTVHLVEEE
jgi:membrane protein implicated in regulation of membrane protease activity